MNSKNLLNMFMSEGLVDGNLVPQDLPKLDANIQQNKTAQMGSKLEVPKDQEPAVPQNKPELPDSLKKKDSKEEKVEGSDYKMALEATSQCLSLAEYHLGKLNKMKELEEIEDVNLDKLGAAHKIITDTRQALQEMLKKCDECKKKTESIGEAIETKEPDLEQILKEPKKYITQSLSKSDFVQAGNKRISLVNEKYAPYSKRMILVLLRESMVASIKNEADGVNPIYCIDGVYYKANNLSPVMKLVPFERQATARDITSYLARPDKFEDGKKRLEKLV